METKIMVSGGEASYPVFAEAGVVYEALPGFVMQHSPSSVVIVTNETVAPLYGTALQSHLPNCTLITVPDGERYKTLHTVQHIYDELLRHQADRSTLLVALGGGVITDMAGFAAATFMRGISLVQAPTTLLAMVDAAVGGKVGVDVPQGKNLVGAFKDPLAVFADPETLKTLPEIELACGMAEIIKAGLIDGGTLWQLLQEKDPPVDELIRLAIRFKGDIVAQDRTEKGMRMLLNLGHTFAHALEQVSEYTIKHGQAVAIGLVGAADLSARCGLCDLGLIDLIEQTLEAYNLPTHYHGYEPQILYNAMIHDKKWRDGESRFVLLKDIGQAVIEESVPSEYVLAALQRIHKEGTR